MEQKQKRSCDNDYQILEDLLHWNEEEEVLDAEYEPFRTQLRLGADEEELRKMAPENGWLHWSKQNLDPYHFINLAC